jgi:serpin B
MRLMLQILFGMTLSVMLITTSYSQPAARMAKSDNQFAFDLYSRLVSNQGNIYDLYSRLDSNQGNIFFSPYGLFNLLNMAYEGARGETAQEMSDVLHLSSDAVSRRAETSAFIKQISQNKGYLSAVLSLIQQIKGVPKTNELYLASALWTQIDYPLKNDYLKLIKNTYYAEARNLNFVAYTENSFLTVNKWISENSKNHINDLLSLESIPHDIRDSDFILTDAVYFESKWETPFEKKDTKLDTFWPSPDQSIETDMMELNHSFKYTDNDQVQVLQVPYKNGDLSMFIVLPRSKDIQDLKKDLTESMFKKWQDSMTRQEVKVYLPKFNFEIYYRMKGVLTKMGMNLAFDKLKADFSGMTGQAELYINQVYYKTWININEEGTETEAAAATAVLKGRLFTLDDLSDKNEKIFRCDLPFILQNKKIFRADHPFIFVIQDNKTGHILFMGRLSYPQKSIPPIDIMY